MSNGIWAGTRVLVIDNFRGDLKIYLQSTSVDKMECKGIWNGMVKIWIRKEVYQYAIYSRKRYKAIF